MRDGSTLIDISVPLEEGMVSWPDNPPLRVDRVFDRSRGDPATVSKIEMSVHTGTHVDAPAHFRGGGDSVDAIPLDAWIGRARVMEIEGAQEIGPGELGPHEIQAGERILLKTDNSKRRWWREAFREEFAHLTADGARFLAERRVRCVGVHYLSVAAPGGDAEAVHRALLDRDVAIIEGLNLLDVSAGEYELLCAPLRLVGADGAPARAVLRRIDGETNG